MDLSYRLNKIAQKVSINGTMADIGTDHAYIPIYLYKNNKIKKAIACDISKGSLQKAKDNILKYNLLHCIETRLSNGLLKITKKDNVDTIVIAGMGGMLMIDILTKGLDIAKNVKEIILQPQKDIDKVRRFLHKNGFKIIDDEMIIDEGKYYTIIKANLGSEQPYTHEQYIFGKFEIEQKSLILKEYIKTNVYKMESVLKNIKNQKGDFYHIENEINIYKEVLKCL